jgi:integrase
MPRLTNHGVRKRCGCGRANWNRCPDEWHLNFRYGGEKEIRVSLAKVARERDERPPRTRREAQALADRLRDEIRRGLYPPRVTAAQATPLSVGAVVDRYKAEFVNAPTRRPRGAAEMTYMVDRLCRAEVPAGDGAKVRFDTLVLAEVTRADVEALRAWCRAQQQAGVTRVGAKGGETGVNRLLSRTRAFFNWAVAAGYLDATPFKRGGVPVVKLESSVETPRQRRLQLDVVDGAGNLVQPGEERRLLAVADAHLRAVIVGALTTGARVGELLSLKWSDIRRDAQGEPRWLDLAATNTKTGEARTIPIGPRLRAELSMRKHAADGSEHPPTAFVFGNTVGERVQRVQRAWEDCVLRAHGHEPVRQRGVLTAASRAAYRAIDLHLHDLRRQFACSLLESGADL